MRLLKNSAFLVLTIALSPVALLGFLLECVIVAFRMGRAGVSALLS